MKLSLVNVDSDRQRHRAYDLDWRFDVRRQNLVGDIVVATVMLEVGVNHNDPRCNASQLINPLLQTRQE